MSDYFMLSNTHLIIRNALSAEMCDLLSDYARLKEKNHPKRRKGTDPLSNIHREYGDPIMEVLLEKFKPIIEQATHLELWPTLSFYYTYKKGNQLNPHKDRNSCQIVAGLCIGADEHFKQTSGTWPLMFNLAGKVEEVAVQYGDLVIFKGHETQHWREPFKGEWFISAIFGYVDKNGPFAFQKYDQRKSLGKPHVGMLRWSLGCLVQNLKTRLLG